MQIKTIGLSAPILVIAVALFAAGYLPGSLLFLIFLFAGALVAFRTGLADHRDIFTVPAWLLAVISGLVIGLYRPDGFNYRLIFSVSQLHEGGLPFALYVNIGKGLAGWLALLLLLPLVDRQKAVVGSALHTAGLVLILTAIILITAWVLLDLALVTKPVEFLLPFGLVNLLVTCVAEEAFMRLLFQLSLAFAFARMIPRQWLPQIIALLLTTALFIVTHSTASAALVVVFGLAGFCYGLVFLLTRNIYACIALHFLVNFIHFAFLTYPLG